MKKTDFEVRKIQVTASVKNAFSVLYLSDFHFNKNSKALANWMLEKTTALNPDIVLLGGDYVDSKRGLAHFDYFLEGIAKRKNVFAIAGNHDYFFGIKSIQKTIEQQGIYWLEKDHISIDIDEVNVHISGSTLQKANIDSDIAILCVHKPKLLNGNLHAYQLAFAGHLHGSQFVFWETKKGLYPGRFFYKWNTLQREKDGCLCLISKGLGDTLPLRFNCKKEVIFVNIRPER